MKLVTRSKVKVFELDSQPIVVLITEITEDTKAHITECTTMASNASRTAPDANGGAQANQYGERQSVSCSVPLTPGDASTVIPTAEALQLKAMMNKKPAMMPQPVTTPMHRAFLSRQQMKQAPHESQTQRVKDTMMAPVTKLEVQSSNIPTKSSDSFF